MFVDLHLHSCFSDGTQAPEQIAAVAKARGFSLIALADHNTCAGYPALREACGLLGVDCLPGMELDCRYDRYEIHILAYGFRMEEPLLALAGQCRHLLLEMSRDLVLRMEKDHPTLSLEEYDAWDYDPTLGGWKGLHYLLRKGVTQELTEGMALYAAYGCDYTDYPFPSAEEVCRVIRQAGGIPVLAHPCNWFDAGDQEGLRTHLDRLVEAGIGGIECYYPANSPEMTRFCRDYCQRKGLLITAGSDAHGDFQKRLHGVEYYIGAVRVERSQVALHPLQTENSEGEL